LFGLDRKLFHFEKSYNAGGISHMDELHGSDGISKCLEGDGSDVIPIKRDFGRVFGNKSLNNFIPFQPVFGKFHLELKIHFL